MKLPFLINQLAVLAFGVCVTVIAAQNFEGQTVIDYNNFKIVAKSCFSLVWGIVLINIGFFGGSSSRSYHLDFVEHYYGLGLFLIFVGLQQGDASVANIKNVGDFGIVLGVINFIIGMPDNRSVPRERLI